MRRAVSVIMCILLIVSLHTNMFAAQQIANHTNTTASNYVFKETASEIRVVAYNEIGEVLFVAVDKENPAVVYEWRTTVSAYTVMTENYATLNSMGIQSLLQMPDARVYEIGYPGPSAVVQDTSGAQLQAVENAMIDLYGELRTWEKTMTNRIDYAPLQINVYETDYVSRFYNGKADIGTSASLAGAAASIAATMGIPYAAAISILCTIVGVTDSLVNVARSFSVYMYYANYLTVRSGVVKDDGVEHPTHSVTRTYWRYFGFEETANGSTDESDYLIDSGECDIIYAPSEYEFSYRQLMEDAYEIYTN